MQPDIPRGKVSKIVIRYLKGGEDESAIFMMLGVAKTNKKCLDYLGKLNSDWSIDLHDG